MSLYICDNTVDTNVCDINLCIKELRENLFLDSYVIEFLDLPKNFKEADLRKGLIRNMKELSIFVDESGVSIA